MQVTGQHTRRPSVKSSYSDKQENKVLNTPRKWDVILEVHNVNSQMFTFAMVRTRLVCWKHGLMKGELLSL